MFGSLRAAVYVYRRVDVRKCSDVGTEVVPRPSAFGRQFQVASHIQQPRSSSTCT